MVEQSKTRGAVEFLTVREVAGMLRTSGEFVRTRAISGEIPGFKVGGTYRFKPADIQRWLERCKISAGVPRRGRG